MPCSKTHLDGLNILNIAVVLGPGEGDLGELSTIMYRAQWEGKLAINKHGDLPTEHYFPLVKIIHDLPHSLIFNPHTKAHQIYPRSRQTLTLEMDEFKKIHSFYFPKYDYRPKKYATLPNTNDFIIMNSENYDELIQSQQHRKRSNKEKQHRSLKVQPLSTATNSSLSPVIVPTTSAISPILDESLSSLEACKSVLPHDQTTGGTISTTLFSHVETPLIFCHEETPVFFREPSIAVNCGRYL
ncbi:13712_t:CDS:2 [Acaulospora colombiana]|uniref:13712_t:CDS:1 n=1 Tax=Acaulospora colombiana TaxID=27376 RepID=A0ACA9LLG7_9GLOM|nr:13712_t:CDS:2 [Acaulospora colombiana]